MSSSLFRAIVPDKHTSGQASGMIPVAMGQHHATYGTAIYAKPLAVALYRRSLWAGIKEYGVLQCMPSQKAGRPHGRRYAINQ